MEIGHFGMRICSMIGFGLIFHTIIVSSAHSSSSGQSCSLEKYITKTYFDKYDSLIDSEFNNFIENEITLGSCKVHQGKNYDTPSVLRHNIIGEGSHRRLSSSVRFNMPPDFQSELTTRSCVVIFIERLPTGVFADPFELQHLVQRGAFTDAAVFGDTNLELPSFRSNRSVVEIHMNASKVLSSKSGDLEVKIEVPLHARYQPLGLGLSRVELGQPDLFICCSIEGNSQNRRRIFMSRNYSSDHNISPLVWDIPCGIKEHAGVVSVVTFIFAIITALLIVSASVFCSDITISNKLKH